MLFILYVTAFIQFFLILICSGVYAYIYIGVFVSLCSLTHFYFHPKKLQLNYFLLLDSTTSLQDNQSTEPSQVTGLTPPIESFTLSITTLVILVITAIVIFIIISVVAIIRCRLRSKHDLEGEAGIILFYSLLPRLFLHLPPNPRINHFVFGSLLNCKNVV